MSNFSFSNLLSTLYIKEFIFFYFSLLALNNCYLSVKNMCYLLYFNKHDILHKTFFW